MTTEQARVARIEKARAERRFQDVRRLAESLVFEIGDAIRDLAGATPARKLMVGKALEYLDVLAKEAGADPSVQADLAEAYLKVGEVQNSLYRASLGDAAGALESFRKVQSMAEAILRANPGNVAWRRLLARSRQGIGGALVATGAAGQAVESLRNAIPIYEELSMADSADVETRVRLADSYNQLGDALGSKAVLNLSDFPGALEQYRRALRMYERLSVAQPNDLRIRSGLAVSYALIGDTQKNGGDTVAALQSYGQSLAIYESLVKADSTNAQYRRNLAAVLDRTGPARAAAGDRAGALKDMRRDLALDEQLAAADASDATAQESLWFAYVRLGDFLADASDMVGTLENYRKAADVIESLSAAHPDNLQLRLKLSDTLVGLGDSLVKSGRREDGLRLISRGVLIQKTLADRSQASPHELSDYAGNLLNCDPGYPCDAASAVLYARRAVELTKAGDPERL